MRLGASLLNWVVLSCVVDAQKCITTDPKIVKTHIKIKHMGQHCHQLRLFARPLVLDLRIHDSYTICSGSTLQYLISYETQVCLRFAFNYA